MGFSFPLSCPACKGAVRWDNGVGACPCTRRRAVLRGDRVADFLGDEDGGARQIREWPHALVPNVASWLDAARSGSALPADALDQARGAGLIDAESRLTPLGRDVAYHLGEYRRQGTQDEFLPPGFLDSLGPDSRVLDVGCGAGQTLRRLPLDATSEGVGLDRDLAALVLGCRLTEAEGRPPQFVRGSGEALPFPDGAFTHALCRVAINYMHQGRVLREMTRVLRPGGVLYLHVEGPGFDWALLRSARSWRAVLSKVRDLTLGVVLSLTGRQPAPGGRFGGGRVFGTARRFQRVLSRTGCTILTCETTGRCGPLPRGFKLLARKR